MSEWKFYKPEEIEQRSMEIIEAEFAGQNIVLPDDRKKVIKRVIHTTADFDYAHNLCFSEQAVELAKALLRDGATIVTDTNMALSGINRRALAAHGCKAVCFMAEPDVAEEAKARGVTRAAVSMERAAELPGRKLFAVGNAPTALIALHQMMEEGRFCPDFIIGVPVGFVNVVEAKELILHSRVPHIVARGRKGGSTVAAAICNSLLYDL